MVGRLRLTVRWLRFDWRHRYRRVEEDDAYVGTCTCGWRAEHPHWSKVSAQQDWEEHYVLAKLRAKDLLPR